MKYSVGRITSGCFRNCYFCVVPKHEPNGIRYIQHPKDIWREGTILRLLDDNLLAHKQAFTDLHQWATENKVVVRGDTWDARLVSSEYAGMLKDIRMEYNRVHFSFDISGYWPQIKVGLDNMRNSGWNMSALVFLIYCHDEAAIPDAKKRWCLIRAEGADPYLMVNPENRTPRLTAIAARARNPAVWRKLSDDEVWGERTELTDEEKNATEVEYSYEG
jgi:hypothetical protein